MEISELTSVIHNYIINRVLKEVEYICVRFAKKINSKEEHDIEKMEQGIWYTAYYINENTYTPFYGFYCLSNKPEECGEIVMALLCDDCQSIYHLILYDIQKSTRESGEEYEIFIVAHPSFGEHVSYEEIEEKEGYMIDIELSRREIYDFVENLSESTFLTVVLKSTSTKKYIYQFDLSNFKEEVFEKMSQMKKLIDPIAEKEKNKQKIIFRDSEGSKKTVSIGDLASTLSGGRCEKSEN